MKLILEAVIVKLDEAGHVKGRLIDFTGLVMRMTGAEIDGVHFRMEDQGTGVELILEAGPEIRLSKDINTNYPAPPNSPAKQISFKYPEARFTANVLNKFLRRVNKDFPENAVLIRDVRGLLNE
jgi:hypothetical protein